MKKTIIALMALAGVAMADTVDTTFTTTNAVSTKADNYSAAGFAFTLSGTALSTVSTPTGTTWATTGSIVELTSITLVTGSRDATIEPGKHYLVITDTSKNIIGWSTSANSAVGESTWTFTAGNDKAVTLNTNTTYYVFAENSYTAGATLSPDSCDLRVGTSGVVDYTSGVGTTYTGLSFIDANGTSKSTRYAPAVTIITKAIPEPTTATLSLLALAGLAARRRRK